MTDPRKPLSCHHCGISRRKFIATGGAAAAGILASSWTPACSKGPKMRIRTIYALHAPVQPGPDWPNVGFDFKPVMKRVDDALRAAFPRYEFLTSMAKDPDETKRVIAGDAAAPVDGYIVYQMNAWNRVIQDVAETGKPALYVDFPYGGSGGFLVYTADLIRKGKPNVGFVASARPEDLTAAVRCFETAKASGADGFAAAVAAVRVGATPKPGDLACTPDAFTAMPTADLLKTMKGVKILAVNDTPGDYAAWKDGLGIEVVNVPFDEVNDAWAKADKTQAAAIADRWEKTAAKIEGVDRATLETCAAMYLAEKAVMKKRGAMGFTMNCLGGFYGGKIHAYPCLGFHELQNEGLVGGCECDVRSAATMAVGNLMTGGRPGYISDPVMDTATRQIIYAHCVASNRVFGPKGATNPFEILTHSEDRQGASVRSTMPLGYMTTTIELGPERKEILFHRGKAVDNNRDDRACRTKLAVEPVGDFEKLFREWDQWGWHRVTFYGDMKEPVFALADALGWKILEEA